VPFDSFLQYISASETNFNNNHWQKQCVLSFEKLFPNTIFHKIEDGFTEPLSQILKNAEVPYSWIVHAAGHKKNSSTNGKNKVYTSELADKVYDIYKEDFDKFQYSRNSWLDY
jgi:hypothetical protein